MKTILITTCLILFAVAPSLGQTPDMRDTIYVSAENIQVKAQKGVIQVPEKRRRAGSRQIPIHFIRLKSLAKTPQVPLIYLEGGGSPCTWQAEEPDMLSEWIPYLQVSDVILVDQRGTADEDLLYISELSYPADFMINEKAAGDHWKKMAVAALPKFQQKGIDVTGYTLEENANDIRALAGVLGISRYSILGFSFGTQVGLTLNAMYPDQIACAVLAGVESPGTSFNHPTFLDAQVKTITKLVAKDKSISGKVPDLGLLLLRVMKKLEKSPVKVHVKNPLTGSPMDVMVGPFGLALVLRLDIDDAADIPVLPRLLYSIDQGDVSVLEWFVQKRIVFAFALPANGLTQGIDRHILPAEMRAIKEEAHQSIFGNVVNFPFYHVMDSWPAPDLTSENKGLKKYNVRTLLLSGDLDCRTPVAQAEAVRRHFSNSTHLIVTNAGHEQILSNDDVQNLVVKFLIQQDVSHEKASNDPIRFVPLVGASSLHPSVELLPED